MRNADLRRLLFAVLVVLGAAVPTYRAIAYDINDILSVDINDDTYKNICQSQRVLDALDRLQNGYLKQIVRDTINELKDALTTYLFQVIKCQITQFDKTVEPSIFGFQLGSITFKGPNCNQTISSSVSAVIKRNTIDKFRNDFNARCIADGARKKVTEDIRRITLENGPDGGPAFVSDWTALYVDEDARAINRFNAVLVNTDICPYFRDAVYQYFGVPQAYIDEPPELTGLGMRTDGGDSFNQQAACSLPPSFTPAMLDNDWLAMGGFDTMEALLQPENNFSGFIRMAEAELAKQRDIVVSAAVNEAVAGGGFRGVYGDASQSCLNRDPNGKCLALGPVQQPAGAIRDANAAAVQGEIDWINNSKEMNTLMGDVRSRIASMVMSLNQDPLNYESGTDQSSQNYQDIGAGTSDPEDVHLPEDPDSGGSQGPPGSSCGSTTDAACTAGIPDCLCIRGCSDFTQLPIQIDLAVRAACVQFPAQVDNPDSCSQVVGTNQAFIAAVAQTSLCESQLHCRPSPVSDREIVADLGGVATAVEILTPTGSIRHPGEAIRACQPGSL